MSIIVALAIYQYRDVTLTEIIMASFPKKKLNFSLLLVANVLGADAEKKTIVSMVDYVLFVDRLMPHFYDA